MDFPHSSLSAYLTLQVAQRLLRMAETIDKKTSNSIKQKLEEEFKNVTVFQLSYEAFKNACRQTLTSLQGSINGWQQYFLINHGESINSWSTETPSNVH